MSHAFRDAVEARDLDGMRDALHPSVVLNSPVVFRPYEGREAVMGLLAHIVEVLEAFRYTDELTGVGSLALVFKARVGDRDVQGVDLLRVDEADLVRELTVLIRPMSALVAVAEAMRERMEASGPSR
jgi:hypothetical protein